MIPKLATLMVALRRAPPLKIYPTIGFARSAGLVRTSFPREVDLLSGNSGRYPLSDISFGIEWQQVSGGEITGGSFLVMMGMTPRPAIR
jgi:hypothetical protein